ncbi:MFS transporter [Streptomyces sp. AC536]|uniref:MFS transporter n=1 Tax=Streptomyces buecherae TaxID=2763006 RepID=UPI00164E862F|nr:MFS transporter [Streptomyces buecherae]MBC3982044.1 MFS transporter [Streptomyces buecherae]QNJ41663.1 MFS transporter [Streptomyces buecherae]
MRTAQLRRFVAARTLSLLGDRAAEAALPIVLLLVTDDPLVAGLVTAANILPTLLLSLPVGHLADTRERRRLMVAADVWRAVWGLALVWALAAPEPSVALLVGLTFLMGCGDVLFSVSAHAYLPALVPSARIMRANAAVEAGDAAATLAGPALAGFLVARLPHPVALAVNAGSFAASAALLARLPAAPVRPAAGPGLEGPTETRAGHAETTPAGRRRDVFAGFRLLATERLQRVLQLAYLYLHVSAGAAVLVVVALSVQALHLGPARVGLVLSAAGVGGLLVTLVVVRFVEHLPWGPLLGVALGGLAASFLWLSVARGFADAFCAVLCVDACSAFAFVTAGSARQVLTPAALLGRLTAATGLVNAAVRAAGVLGCGAVLAWLGPRPAAVALGAVGLACAVPLLLARSARDPLAPRRERAT